MFQTKPKMRFPQFAQKLLQLRALARTKEQEARRRKEGGILVFQRTLKSRVSIDQPEPFFVQREKEGQAAKPDKENGEKVRFWTKLICKSLDSFVELIRDNWRNDHWVNGAWVVGSRTGWTDEKLIAWHQLPWNITEKVLDTQLDWNQLKSFEDWTFIIKYTICRSTVHKACIRFNTRGSNFFILLCWFRFRLPWTKQTRNKK